MKCTIQTDMTTLKLYLLVAQKCSVKLGNNVKFEYQVDQAKKKYISIVPNMY